MKFFARVLMFLAFGALILSYLPFSSSDDDNTSVKDLNVEKFLGTWYEIARMPSVFEDGLVNTTSTYSRNNDGTITIVNSGRVHTPDGEQKSITGKVWLADYNKTGRLRVRFVWPFVNEYRIVDLEQQNYHYVVIASASKKRLWILSRSAELDGEIYDGLFKNAEGRGFDTRKLFKVPQTWPSP